MKKKYVLYSDPNREGRNASQREIPKLTVKDNCHSIEGYQKFNIYGNNVLEPLDPRLISKSRLAEQLLADLSNSCVSLNDLGCNSGYFSILAKTFGVITVNAIDHDFDYLQILQSLSKSLGLQINDYHEKASMYGIKADITFAFSLMHWIYSCTDTHGSIREIIKHLAEITNVVAVVEWIDPKDEAIQRFQHTSYNNDQHEEEYTHEVFMRCSSQFFSEIEFMAYTNINTRSFYLLWK